MAVKLPLNQAIKSQYTMGGEYVLPNNIENSYIGYYYELNGRTFAGKEFKYDAPELLKNTLKASNPLFQNPETLEYAKLAKISISQPDIPSYFYIDKSGVDVSIRYFLYQLNTELIKEISKESYDKLTIYPFPLYKIVFLSYTSGFNDMELKEAEKIIPGITTFINTSYVPPFVEDPDGNFG
jgi:hypothetical protein